MTQGAGTGPFTRGFIDRLTLLDHYTRHAGRLGLTTVRDYAERADRFCGGPRSSTTHECVRPPGQFTGDIVRFDTLTGEFGVRTATSIIRTYYRLDLSRHRRKYPTDLHYFRAEC